MPTGDRLQIARECYAAYESGDRSALDKHLAPGLMFFSPPDPGIDRTTYFERCWPNAEQIDWFEFVRLFEHEDEVFVSYESAKTDGKRFRNAEVLSFEGDQIIRIEVYFGWNL